MNQRKLDTCTRPLFYREIPLTQGQVALVDVEDYDWLRQWKWCAHWCEHTGSFYAERNSPRINGKRGPIIKMHRFILGLVPGDGLKGDHINLDTLDNRRSNLRVATPSQNVTNGSIRATNTSGFKGVSQIKSTGKWRVQVSVNRVKYYRGQFDTQEEAYAAYCAGALELQGEFARLA